MSNNNNKLITWLTSDTNFVPLKGQFGVIEVGIAVNLQMDSHGHLLGDVARAG